MFYPTLTASATTPEPLLPTIFTQRHFYLVFKAIDRAEHCALPDFPGQIKLESGQVNPEAQLLSVKTTSAMFEMSQIKTSRVSRLRIG